LVNYPSRMRNWKALLAPPATVPPPPAYNIDATPSLPPPPAYNIDATPTHADQRLCPLPVHTPQPQWHGPPPPPSFACAECRLVQALPSPNPPAAQQNRNNGMASAHFDSIPYTFAAWWQQVQCSLCATTGVVAAEYS
jgi:hypothetical protein